MTLSVSQMSSRGCCCDGAGGGGVMESPESLRKGRRNRPPRIFSI